MSEWRRTVWRVLLASSRKNGTAIGGISGDMLDLFEAKTSDVVNGEQDQLIGTLIRPHIMHYVAVYHEPIYI